MAEDLTFRKKLADIPEQEGGNIRKKAFKTDLQRS